MVSNPPHTVPNNHMRFNCILPIMRPDRLLTILIIIAVLSGSSMLAVIVLMSNNNTLWSSNIFTMLIKPFTETVSVMPDVCISETERTIPLVQAEINRNFIDSSTNMLARLAMLDPCTPVVQRIPCSVMADSALPCKSDFYLERFNYHTQHDCLLRMTDELYAKQASQVPRLFHTVWYYDEHTEMRFHQYLGFLSILRYFKPEVVFVWNRGVLPTGRWWHELIGHLNQNSTGNMTLTEYYAYQDKNFTIERIVHFYKTKLVSIVRQPPEKIYGNEVKREVHYSDIIRMEAAILYGGLYADTDVIAIRSFDPLLNFSATMGRDAPKTLSNGMIFARRHSAHLYLLHKSYETFSTLEWSAHSTVGNNAIHVKCPSLLHVEDTTLIVPNYWQRYSMYKNESIDLSQAYSIHVWWREMPINATPSNIQTWQCMAGRVFRNIYNGVCSEFCG